jgi:hypothetical protein
MLVGCCKARWRALAVLAPLSSKLVAALKQVARCYSVRFYLDSSLLSH